MTKPATPQHKVRSRSSSSEVIARRLASHEDSSEEEYSEEEEDDVFHSAKESLDLSEGKQLDFRDQNVHEIIQLK